MTQQPGAMPAGLAAAAIAGARIPFTFRLDRHNDPAVPPTPAPPAPPAVPAPAPVPAPAAEPAADDDAPLGPAGEKALAEFKQRARAAEAAAKAAEDKVREFEERDKSELEKATAAAERATAEAAAAKAELVRQRVINETGLPVDLAEFLPAGDEDTVRAAAEKLKAATTAAARPGTPRPDPSQGAGRIPPGPTDYRSAPREDVVAEMATLGIRPRGR